MRDPRVPYWCYECNAQHGVGVICARELEIKQMPSAQIIPENALSTAHYHAPWLWDEDLKGFEYLEQSERERKLGHEGAVAS